MTDSNENRVAEEREQMIRRIRQKLIEGKEVKQVLKEELGKIDLKNKPTR